MNKFVAQDAHDIDWFAWKQKKRKLLQMAAPGSRRCLSGEAWQSLDFEVDEAQMSEQTT